MLDGKAVGARIKELRNRKNLDQMGLAKKMGYKSFSTVSKWETGDINGGITINNNEAKPVPVTVNNLDDVFEMQEKANENHKELNVNQAMVLETMVKLVEVNKEILKELKKLNKKN